MAVSSGVSASTLPGDLRFSAGGIRTSDLIGAFVTSVDSTSTGHRINVQLADGTTDHFDLIPGLSQAEVDERVKIVTHILHPPVNMRVGWSQSTTFDAQAFETAHGGAAGTSVGVVVPTATGQSAASLFLGLWVEGDPDILEINLVDGSVVTQLLGAGIAANSKTALTVNSVVGNYYYTTDRQTHATLASQTLALVLTGADLLKSTEVEDFAKVGNTTVVPRSKVATIAAGEVGTTQLADDAVDDAKLADNAVTSSAIRGHAVTRAKITPGSVTEEEMADAAVTPAKLDAGTDTKKEAFRTRINAYLKISEDGTSRTTTGEDMDFKGGVSVTQVGDITEVHLPDPAQYGIQVASRIPISYMGELIFLPYDYSTGVKQDSTVTVGANSAGNWIGYSQHTYQGTFGSLDRSPSPLTFIGGSGTTTAYRIDTIGGDPEWIDSIQMVDINGTEYAVGDARYHYGVRVRSIVSFPSSLTGTTFTLNVRVTATDWYWTDGSVISQSAGFYEWSASTTAYMKFATLTELVDGSVTTSKLADDAVTAAKLADGSVSTATLGASSVTNAKIADTSVNAQKIVNGTVITTKIADSAVTSAKLADASVTSAKLASDAAATQIAAGVADWAETGNTELIPTDKLPDPVDATLFLDDTYEMHGGTNTLIQDNATGIFYKTVYAIEHDIRLKSVKVRVRAPSSGNRNYKIDLLRGVVQPDENTVVVNGNDPSYWPHSDTQRVEASFSGTSGVETDHFLALPGNGIVLARGEHLVVQLGRHDASDGRSYVRVVRDLAEARGFFAIRYVGSGTDNLDSSNDTTVDNVEWNDEGLWIEFVYDLEYDVGAAVASHGNDDHVASGAFTKTGDQLSLRLTRELGDHVDVPAVNVGLTDGSVTEAKLATAVQAKLQTDAEVTALAATAAQARYTDTEKTKLANTPLDGSITAAKLANSAVTSAAIQGHAVTTPKINPGAVTTDEMGSGAITTAKIADGAVTTTQLGDTSVATAKIADNAVTAAKIADGAVVTAGLGDLSVATAKIADDAVTAAKLLMMLTSTLW